MPAYKELFERYPNEVFIETGSYTGEGIQAALDAGFKEIYSIELSNSLWSYCMLRFNGKDNVHLLLGDSSKLLKRLLKKIRVPCTFWLDAHYSGGVTAKGSQDSPLIQELEIIEDHHIKTHTILIDDMRCWNMNEHGFDVREIVRRITAINDAYCFSAEDGIDINLNVYRNDILVAQCLQ